MALPWDKPGRKEPLPPLPQYVPSWPSRQYLAAGQTGPFLISGAYTEGH